MNNKSIKQYLKGEINWYDSKSIQNKKWFAILIFIEIIISALIPFTSLFISTSINAKYIIALMGCIITTISGLQATFSYRDHWIKYRHTGK